MTELAKMLRREQRRHFFMSFGLVAAAVTAGTMVTNERGIFSTVIGGGPLSALERAFAAIAVNDDRTPLLFRRTAASQGREGAFGDEPFDVLGAPADLRRRLMEALGGDADPEAVAQNQVPDILSRQITPDQIAANTPPTEVGNVGDVGDGGTGSPGFGSPPTTGGPGPSVIVDPNNPALNPGVNDDVPAQPVPEPAVWALMIGGFGLIGAALRTAASARRRRAFRLAE